MQCSQGGVIIFFCSTVFLEVVWEIGEDEKMIGMLVCLRKENKLKRCSEKELSMDNILMDLD